MGCSNRRRTRSRRVRRNQCQATQATQAIHALSANLSRRRRPACCWLWVTWKNLEGHIVLSVIHGRLFPWFLQVCAEAAARQVAAKPMPKKIDLGLAPKAKAKHGLAPKAMAKHGLTPKAGLTAKAGSAFSISTMLCSSPQNGNMYYQFNILGICGHQVKAAPPLSESARKDGKQNVVAAFCQSDFIVRMENKTLSPLSVRVISL